MNDLREKIKELVRQQQFMSDDGGLVADRILAIINAERTPTPEAEAKLPEGVEIRQAKDGLWNAETNKHWLDTEDEWHNRIYSNDHIGVFFTKADALAAALKAPPVPKVEKPKVSPMSIEEIHALGIRCPNGMKAHEYVKSLRAPEDDELDTPPSNPSPAVTHADMRRLADLFEKKSFYKKAINEVFKEPA